MKTALEKFPPLETATREGLLAVGGDLSEARLLYAYRNGIFPWYGAGEPILWWSPDPRCVLLPHKFSPSRSLKKFLRQRRFDFTLDTAFARVIDECAAPRDMPANGYGGDKHEKSGGGTWINADIKRAYTALHRAGIAHSAEIWQGGELVGGLYGLAIGGAFFGESMFSRANDTSKAALALLIAQLREWDFRLIDCQVSSAHLLRLGAEEMPRDAFIKLLQAALCLEGKAGSWVMPTPRGQTPKGKIQT